MLSIAQARNFTASELVLEGQRQVVELRVGHFGGDQEAARRSLDCSAGKFVELTSRCAMRQAHKSPAIWSPDRYSTATVDQVRTAVEIAVWDAVPELSDREKESFYSDLSARTIARHRI